MTVSDLLKEAWASVIAADLPEHVQAEALRGAIQFHGGVPSGPTASGPRVSARTSGDATPVQRIADRVGVSAATAEQVFNVVDDAVELVLPASKLDAAKSRATQQIGLLIAAGRQALALDDGGWTSTEPIRMMSDYFGKYDSSNFTAHVRGLGDAYSVNVRGTGRTGIEVRMTAPAWEHAKALVRSIAGTSED